MCLSSRCALFSITLAALSINSGSCFALSTGVSSSSSFWDNPQLVQSLPDPPSDELLKLIQAKPYRGGFEPAREINHETYPPHGSYSPRIVYGSIPQDLTGSLATNGPGRIRIRGRQYGHWFDGDGFVTLLNIDGQKGTATFQAKYVKTKRYKAQQKLMEKLFIDCDDSSDANLFKQQQQLKYEDDSPPLAFAGAWTPGGKGQWYQNVFRIPTNPANTATIWLPPSLAGQGSRPRLYALCEGGNPIELDPLTLDTLQNGDETPFTSSDGRETTSSFFSAHVSHCPQTGDMYNHGYCLRPGPLQKEINIMKLNKFGDLVQQETSPLPFDSFVHDSTISQNYMIYFLPPYYIPNDTIYQFLAGQSPLGKLTEWDPNMTSKVHVHCKDDLELKWVIDLPHAMSMYHLVDAHEIEHIGMEGNQKEGEVMLAVRALDHEPVDREGLERQFADQYRVEDPRLVAKLKEYIFHLGSDGVSSLVSCKDVAGGAAECEYPALNHSFDINKRRRYCWTNAASTKPTDWLDGIQKVDMQEGTSSRVVTFGEGSYAGAPAFVPRNSKDEGATAEDEGFILTTIYRALEHRSDVAVLDAATLDLLCLMELEHHVPYQFHGDFLDGVLRRDNEV